MIIRNKNYSNIKYIIWKYKYFENCWQIFSQLLNCLYFKFLKYMNTSETEEVLVLVIFNN